MRLPPTADDPRDHEIHTAMGPRLDCDLANTMRLALAGVPLEARWDRLFLIINRRA